MSCRHSRLPDPAGSPGKQHRRKVVVQRLEVGDAPLHVSRTDIAPLEALDQILVGTLGHYRAGQSQDNDPHKNSRDSDPEIDFHPWSPFKEKEFDAAFAGWWLHSLRRDDSPVIIERVVPLIQPKNVPGCSRCAGYFRFRMRSCFVSGAYRIGRPPPSEIPMGPSRRFRQSLPRRIGSSGI